MIRSCSILAIAGLLAGWAPAPVSAIPQVSQVQFVQEPDPTALSPQTRVTVTYDLVSPVGPCQVDLMLSVDGGASFTTLPLHLLSGHVGANVAPGTGRTIHFRAAEYLPDQVISQAQFRVRAEDGVCVGCDLWSDPQTWGGTKPGAGDQVTIPVGRRILLDESPPALAGLTINGTLEFARRDLELTAYWIMVHGTLTIGTPDRPFQQQATITLNDPRTTHSVMGMGTRGLFVMGGTLDLHGTPPSVPWTKIADHVPAGGTSLSLVQTPGWQAGDEVALAPTDYYLAHGGAHVSQRLTLANAAGSVLQTVEPVTVARWGRLQYVTSSGLSLDPPAQPYTPPVPDGPTVLDQRAAVGNLSRNIVIQSPEDTAWLTQGFGAQTMVMGAGAMARVNGIEIRRAGQRNRLGAYPWHWHMLSYDPPTTLGDATGHYFRNSTIHSSTNRGVVIHGTNGVSVEDNVIYDVRGHGIFTEDAVERRNQIHRNLVLRIRNTTGPGQLKRHEFEAPGQPEAGSSGFWISNPDNFLVGNHAADCQGFGFWLSFPANPWGLSLSVPIIPNRIQFGQFHGNTTHSNRFDGLMIDLVEIANDGSIQGLQYSSNTDGLNPVWPEPNLRPFFLTDVSTWKNGKGGIWDRARRPQNFRIVSADNCQRFFAGSGDDGLIASSLVIGTSLNNPTPRPGWSGDPTPSAFATYHSSFDIRNNLILNFPAVAGTRSGAFATDDYYLRPVEKGQERNTGNVWMNSHPGVKLQFPFSYAKLVSALWDPHGTWGHPGQWLVDDVPFLTYGQTTSPLTGGAIAGAVATEGPFYGFNDFVVNNANLNYQDFMAIEATRLDSNLVPVGTWTATQAVQGWLLDHMRHFAAHPTGIYRLDFPGLPPPTDLEMVYENLIHTTETLVLGLEFSGAANPSVFVVPETGGPNLRTYYTPVGSLDALRASEGEVYFRDTTNHVVWVKLRGGRWQWWDPQYLESEPDVYERSYSPMKLHLSTD